MFFNTARIARLNHLTNIFTASHPSVNTKIFSQAITVPFIFAFLMLWYSICTHYNESLLYFYVHKTQEYKSSCWRYYYKNRVLTKHMIINWWKTLLTAIWLLIQLNYVEWYLPHLSHWDSLLYSHSLTLRFHQCFAFPGSDCRAIVPLTMQFYLLIIESSRLSAVQWTIHDLFHHEKYLFPIHPFSDVDLSFVPFNKAGEIAWKKEKIFWTVN